MKISVPEEVRRRWSERSYKSARTRRRNETLRRFTEMATILLRRGITPAALHLGVREIVDGDGVPDLSLPSFAELVLVLLELEASGEKLHQLIDEAVCGLIHDS
jgi:hypothetical protein